MLHVTISSLEKNRPFLAKVRTCCAAVIECLISFVILSQYKPQNVNFIFCLSREWLWRPNRHIVPVPCLRGSRRWLHVWTEIEETITSISNANEERSYRSNYNLNINMLNLSFVTPTEPQLKRTFIFKKLVIWTYKLKSRWKVGKRWTKLAQNNDSRPCLAIWKTTMFEKCH